MSVAPAYNFTPPKRNSLTHIPGDEGWPFIGKTLDVLADPKGQIERQSAKYGLVYRSHSSAGNQGQARHSGLIPRRDLRRGIRHIYPQAI